MDRIQLRRDTAARWAEVNPILLEGEVGFETDTNLRKIGDGITKWNDLEYLKAEGITQNMGMDENLVMSQKIVTNELLALGARLIELKALTMPSSDTWREYIGEAVYDDNLKAIRVYTGFNWGTTPFYPGAIYTYNSELYVWDGENLVKENKNVEAELAELGSEVELRMFNNLFDNSSKDIKDSFRGLIDIYPTEDIPEDIELYLYALFQKPAGLATLYIKKGKNGIIDDSTNGIVAMLQLPDSSKLDTIGTYVTKGYSDSNITYRFKVTIDWSLVNTEVISQGVSNFTKLNKNAMKRNFEKARAELLLEEKVDRVNSMADGKTKTVFPFLSKNANVSLLKGLGIYSFQVFGASNLVENLLISYIGYVNSESALDSLPQGIYMYLSVNDVDSTNIVSICYIPETDIKRGIQAVRGRQHNNSGITFEAFIDTESFKAKNELLRTLELPIDLSGCYNKFDMPTKTREWFSKGLIDSDVDINGANLQGIIDVRLLYDRDNYLKNGGKAFFWAYGNLKENVTNTPIRYIYIIKEQYKDFSSVLSYTSIRGESGSLKDGIEQIVVEEQNGSGLAFIVTVDWGKVALLGEIKNDLKVPINPNIPIAVVDESKKTYFIEDSSSLKRIPDGFILDIKMSNEPNYKDLALWYVNNSDDNRAIYIGKLSKGNVFLEGTSAIYAWFTSNGAGSGIEDVKLVPFDGNGGDTTFFMKVNWDKIPLGYTTIKDNWQANLNIKNIPIFENKKDIGFDFRTNLPIFPSQLYLRDDKTIPLFKNSLFTKTGNLEKVDVGLVCKVGGEEQRIISVGEPTYLGGEWGYDMEEGSARAFISRNSDYSKFIFKDLEVFKTSVAELNGKTVSVMSLGDSLTEGLAWSNIPVCMLSDELEKIGVTTRFIGSLVRTLTNKKGQSVKLNYEGRGGWRYRTLTGLESQFAGLNQIVPSSQTKSEWVLGVDGTDMNTIKANNAFLFPATDEDKANYPEFCYHFVEGNSGYNTSYAEDSTLGDYVIFNPTKYFSMRNIEMPDILTIAFGTNEWYLGGFDLEKASASFKFIVQQFRRASSTMKIVVIPSNALNLGRQDSWEKEAAVLTSEVIKVTDELISGGDNNLFVCPIYANCSRWLAWDKLTDTPFNITENNDVQIATISNNVHSFYVDDESNNQYADSLTACVVNLID